MTSVDTTPPAPVPADGNEGWSIEKAKALYNVEGWGVGYFDVSERGRIIVRPDRDHPERSLDLFDLAKDLQEQGVGLPVLLRFSDILRSRIESLSERFASADFAKTRTPEVSLSSRWTIASAAQRGSRSRNQS